MALALMMMGATNGSLVSGDEVNLFGYVLSTATEATAQASCTEDATFSKLGAQIVSGNSGTATFRFRDAGADGNQTFQISGTGVGEDASNSDTLTAGDLLNIAYTDTGTNSGFSWIRCNVELASGYGAFTGSANFNTSVYDVASSTRFMGLSGPSVTDGFATEANCAVKARGYTTYESLQVRCTANARTNNSVFRNRINGGNGSAAITFAAGETGLKTVTGIADAIGDGQTIAVSVTLDTGVEDLSVAFAAACLKSTNTKQDVWCTSNGSGLLRNATATEHFFPIQGYFENLTARTETTARCKPGFAGTASYPRIYVSTNTYGADATLTVYKNGVSLGTATITAGGGAGWYETSGDIGTFDEDDELSFGIVGGTSGAATLQMMAITLAPTVAGTGQPTAKRWGGTKFASIRGNGVW